MARRRTKGILGIIAATTLAAACSGGDGAAGGSSSADGGIGDPAANFDGSIAAGDGPVKSEASDASDANDATVADGPDVPPVMFPTAVPLVFGYTLADAFPGTFLSGAIAIDWPAGTAQPFVLQRGGYIVRLHGDGTRDLTLDFSAVVALRDEAGALGMALHPKFADAITPQPYVYVWYNAEGAPTHQRISRFTWNGATQVFDRASELIMVEQTETTPFHNAGSVRFGPDGFLYFGNGDDQQTDVVTQTVTGGLFSGIFRIDVDSVGGAKSHAPPRAPLNATTQGYFIPNDNPFVGVANAAEEYFALGFRNPYSFAFDKMTGKLWVGDVGDTWREEMDLVVSGGNYGWPIFEGTVRRSPGAPTVGATYPPVYEFTHASIADLTAVGGGETYRGAALPELAGKVLFSTWSTGQVWALDPATAQRTSLVETAEVAPVGYGQDAAGEVYFICESQIWKLVRAPAPNVLPRKLSQTNIFRNLQTLKTPTSLVAYSVRSPLWANGADSQRWVYVPQGQTATMTADGTVSLPLGSMLVKQYDLPTIAQPTNGRTRRLETRVLVVGTETYGMTYRWNAAGTDADLVIEAADEIIADADPAAATIWHFPSMGDCWACHGSEDRVLAFRGEQLNFPIGGASQLSLLAAKGVFDASSIATSPAPLASPSDATATSDARASAYLAANCSSCHHPGASYLGGGDTWNALPGVAAASRGLVNMPHHNLPMATALGLPNAPLVAPGNAAGSILSARLHTIDQDLKMPPLQRTKVDPLGVSVIDTWINSM